jgi:hypothetical protein
MENIARQIEHIRENIGNVCSQTGRDPKDVKLVIVTKSTTLENIIKVIKLGHRHLGENRVQQLKKVSTAVNEQLDEESVTLDQPLKWHMIGHLQRNKVSQALTIASLVHSVDTLRLSEEINTCAAKLKTKARILLQVNTSQEPQKYGVPVGAAIHLAEQIQTLDNLSLAGMMTMAPLTRDENVIRACFARAKELFEEIKGEKVAGTEFRDLSMGMSNDYEHAVEFGATILRIGSAIFN